MPNVTVKLSRAYAEGELTEVVIRPPVASEYWANGEPWQEMVMGKNAYIVENPVTVQTYIDLLVVEPKSKAYRNNLELVDAMAVKDAVLGFFPEARERLRQKLQTS